MSSSRLVFGLLILLGGLGLLLDRLGFFGFSFIFYQWWPALLILLGIYLILKKHHSIIGGSILIIIGTLVLDSSYHLLRYHISSLLWPIIVIILGLWILTPKRSHSRSTIANDNSLDYTALFSGLDTKVDADNFQGGTVTAIFGGAKIDLRDTKGTQKEYSLELNAILGGIELIVPETWKIVASGIPLFGGFDNKTTTKSSDVQDTPVLKINYTAILGGITVKN